MSTSEGLHYDRPHGQTCSPGGTAPGPVVEWAVDLLLNSNFCTNTGKACRVVAKQSTDLSWR